MRLNTETMTKQIGKLTEEYRSLTHKFEELRKRGCAEAQYLGESRTPSPVAGSFPFHFATRDARRRLLFVAFVDRIFSSAPWTVATGFLTQVRKLTQQKKNNELRASSDKTELERKIAECRRELRHRLTNQMSETTSDTFMRKLAAVDVRIKALQTELDRVGTLTVSALILATKTTSDPLRNLPKELDDLKAIVTGPPTALFQVETVQAGLVSRVEAAEGHRRQPKLPPEADRSLVERPDRREPELKDVRELPDKLKRMCFETSVTLETASILPFPPSLSSSPSPTSGDPPSLVPASQNHRRRHYITNLRKLVLPSGEAPAQGGATTCLQISDGSLKSLTSYLKMSIRSIKKADKKRHDLLQASYQKILDQHLEPAGSSWAPYPPAG
ncbi:hypothetical protein BDK51DRAFT_44058 [Blyttiomyces helicus]|uniref:Uncharacterized protein n=1 Tax=Blyttiomyces helicus TaxID=388810 RepID=A0A4P9WBT6_9FUNG|nr:hypothetical protein BDK51DRAFT_44058 [Blyttiomyces helicus]|eukprot:RKO89742.1 hypothetical protein BDK51DRAFT_44058 [Blyttiomyces helicus]